MPQSSVQHMQTMAAAMVELTRQNQELSREINLKKQRYEGYIELESQSRGTMSRRVPQLEKEMD